MSKIWSGAATCSSQDRLVLRPSKSSSALGALDAEDDLEGLKTSLSWLLQVAAPDHILLIDLAPLLRRLKHVPNVLDSHQIFTTSEVQCGGLVISCTKSRVATRLPCGV